MASWWLPATETLTPLKVSVAPLPTKPTFWPPEHAVQLATLAPPANVLLADSASYPVAIGEAGTVILSKSGAYAVGLPDWMVLVPAVRGGLTALVAAVVTA